MKNIIKQTSLFMSAVGMSLFLFSCSMQGNLTRTDTHQLKTAVAVAAPQMNTPVQSVQPGTIQPITAQTQQPVMTRQLAASPKHAVNHKENKIAAVKIHKMATRIASKLPAQVNRMLEPAHSTTSTMSITGTLGFILGLLGLILIWVVPVVGLVFAIVGLILSIIGLGRDTGKGLAIAGLVLSILSLLLFLVVIVIVAAVVL